MSQKIFISTSSFGDFSSEPIDLLKSEGFEVKLNPLGRKLNETETIELLKDTVGVIAGTEKYSETVLNALPLLQTISRVGVGVDNIDFEATARRSINVVATKTDLSKAVAELALAMIFDLSRKITIHNNGVKSHKWSKSIGRLVYGKTLGIIGLGKIGKSLIEITSGLGLKYIAYDTYKDVSFAAAHNLTYVTVNELLKQSDIVSLHLKYSQELYHFLSKEKLCLLNRDAILINTSRGEFIDEKALFSLLKQNSFGGAGLDVFLEEPYDGILCELPNVLLTPHIGSFVKEIRSDMEIEAAQNFIKLMKQ
jgi:D-3-phosphoglycerate dehydrogenase